MSSFKPSRRNLLQMAAAAPAFALPATGARAKLSAPAAAQPAYHRFTVGDARITIVSDGYLGLSASGLGVETEPSEVTAFLEAHYLSTEQNYAHTNHVIIETGDAKLLIDVGSGTRFLNTAGRLMANMETAGIDPASITHVVITHAHPDHVWGIRDDFDEVILPDAEFIIGADEYAWWTAPGRVSQVPESLQQFVVGAVNSLTAEGLEWTMGKDGHEVVPGVRLFATYGHSPGHMSVMVESNGNQLLVLGDSMNHAYISFERPEWLSSFDMEKDQTIKTRLRLLDMAATDRIPVVGYHFPFPGVGHVMRDGGSYRFIPALWRWEG